MAKKKSKPKDDPQPIKDADTPDDDTLALDKDDNDKPSAPSVPPKPGANQLPATPPPAVRPQAAPPAQSDYSSQIAADVRKTTLGDRIGTGLRRLRNWMVTILFGAAFGLLLFALGGRYADEVLGPLGDLNSLQQQVNELEDSLGMMETAQADALATSDTASDIRISESEQRLLEAEERLSQAEERLANTESMVTTQEDLIVVMQTELDATGDQVADFEDYVAQLEDDLPGSEEYRAYNRLLLLMRAWQEVLNARIRLLENNPGLATEILTGVQLTLDEAYLLSSDEGKAELNPIIERIDLVIANITENPFAATGDLEIAWHDLGGLLRPPDDMLSDAEGTAAAAESEDDEAEEGTPTATPTVTPTATPTEDESGNGDEDVGDPPVPENEATVQPTEEP